MMRIQVTFKSGAQIEFRSKTLTSEKRSADGKMVGLKWNTEHKNGPRLHHIDLTDVDAVVILDGDPED